jgi:type I restriction enzyme S subunit
MNKLKTYKFSDLYEMSSGISSKPEQAGHGSPFVSFSTVFNNVFLPDSLPDLMSTSEMDKEKYSIDEGDIFLTRTSETLNELGMSCVAVKDYPEASFSGFLKRLRPKQEDVTYAKFMAFYLRSYLFRKTMNNNAIMTLRASLNEQIFSYLHLVLPSFNEQKRIGDLFFKISEKIEINNKINQELEAMAKTLYDYWFVQFDFPDKNGKPYKTSGGKMVFNEALKREIPVGWSCRLLGDLGNFKNGVNYDPSKPGDIACPIINVRNISKSRYFLKNEDLDIIYLKESDVRKYAVHEGSIIIARSGIPGATRLIADYEENTLYCGFAIHYQLENLDQKLPVFFYLKSIEEIIKNGSGGTILKNVNQATLNNLKIALPKSDDVIELFNNKINPIFSKINLIQKENQKLSELRDWLLPMLMNGQVSVGYAAQEVENLGLVAEKNTKYEKN